MKKNIFLFTILFLSLFSISYSLVPDADSDGVPDIKDKCPNSQTNIVEQFGCSCVQKSCPSDNNPCTDDCSVIGGIPSCTFTNNRNPCPGGYCSGGKCEIPTCTDSDGKNYYVKGKLTYTANPLGFSEEFDRCENSVLIEGICNSPVEHTQNQEQYNCLNGCKDGACISICGNGVLEQGEECDGTNFGTIKVCSDYSSSFARGILSCNNCQLDTSRCVQIAKCSDCGSGFFNLCDEKECLSLGNCEFIDTVFPFPNICQD